MRPLGSSTLSAANFYSVAWCLDEGVGGPLANAAFCGMEAFQPFIALLPQAPSYNRWTLAHMYRFPFTADACRTMAASPILAARSPGGYFAQRQAHRARRTLLFHSLYTWVWQRVRGFQRRSQACCLVAYGASTMTAELRSNTVYASECRTAYMARNAEVR